MVILINMKHRYNNMAAGNNHRSNSGFTLLEVMIALAIAAIALTAVFSSQGSGLHLAIQADRNTTASFLAQEKLAYIQSGLFEYTGEEGTFGEEYPGYSWKVTVEDASFDELEELEQLTGLVVKVNLIIKYGEDQFEQSYITYIVNKRT